MFQYQPRTSEDYTCRCHLSTCRRTPANILNSDLSSYIMLYTHSDNDDVVEYENDTRHAAGVETETDTDEVYTLTVLQLQ